MSDRDWKGCCQVEIHITSQGDVNIYNCAPPAGQAPPPEECPPAPVPPGTCVPLALGVKPKQGQRRKLEKLLEGTPIRSAFAGAFVHASRRYLARQPPANPLEASVFASLEALPPDVKGVLRCALGQFDALHPAERDRLFDLQPFGDLTVPIDVPTLAGAVAAEVAARASLLTFGDPGCVAEHPGKIRVFDPGPGEFLQSQVHICRVNGLRTAQYTPPLALDDYLPSELQEQCVPAVVNGEIQVSCSVQKHNCPGRQSAEEGTCFRVLQIAAGQSVLLEGVNFFSVDTMVRLVSKGSASPGRVVSTHVCGDTDTPVTEVVNGQTVIVADCRVHDRLTFQVPIDLAPGIYEVYVEVPNISGIPTLGSTLTSHAEYIAVTPSSTARFEIVSETLFAHKETSPAFFGSDEVAVRFLTAGLKADGTWCELQHVESLHGNVDSGDQRNMICVVLPQDGQPVVAVAISVLGHEVDNYATYLAQVRGFTDGYLDVMKRLWKVEAGGIALMSALAIPGGPVAVLVVAAVVTALAAAVNLFLALWAPADLIMQDVIFLTSSELAALTSDEFPSPAAADYRSASDIAVKVRPVSKGGGEYVESRYYRCSDEDSEYEFTLRYRRTV
jgi:hypothetical protein